MRLQDATVLITGGSSGLGAACVRRFADAGAKVVIADINQAAGEILAEELHGKARFCHVDVASESSVQAAVQRAVDWGGGLQGLIHCAGVLGAARILGRDGPHDLEEFRRVVEVNLVGTFNVSRLAAAAMAESPQHEEGERGVMIHTSSVAAFEGQIGQVAYSASKGAVASMVLPMARELGRFGIRVTAIAPGVFNTPMMAVAPDSVRKSLEAQTIFPSRLGTAAEYAALAQHIFENIMLNGCVLRLDGAIRMTAK